MEEQEPDKCFAATHIELDNVVGLVSHFEPMVKHLRLNVPGKREIRRSIEREKDVAWVEDDVVIYAGATILGRVTLGRGCVIGGNVWLTRSVPPGSNVVQAQARSEVFAEGAGI